MKHDEPTPRPPDPTDATAGARRDIPPVHRLVERLVESGRADGAPRAMVTDAVRRVLDGYRAALAGDDDAAPLSEAALLERAAAGLARDRRPPLAPVINATGVLLHTGLGRAPMADEAVAAAAAAAAGYAPVEIDLDTGRRSKRADVVRADLGRLTGAEAATVVNNGAAALVVTLAALARDRSVIVSRGELIEIGGSFRLPAIMETSGARLREIGTTNRTRPADYEQAVDDDAGALLKVHTSNFRVEGFTRSVTVAELAAIGRRHRLPVIYDTGSGVLAPSVPGGIPGDEPSAAESIEHGADVVLFSGDKVLGGPQAGIIVGRADLVARIEAHPLTRAMRVDKVRLAALAATLRLHRDPAHAARVMPVLRQLAWPVDELERRARAIAAALAGADATVEVVSSRAYLGGGSVPAQAVPGVAVAVRPRSLPDHELARRLRAGSPAVVARVADGAVRLELRSVFPEQDERLAAAVEAALC